MKKYAVRNINLCTKDCLCLFVCPTGATDTEIAQLGAHHIRIVGVGSSNLLKSTIEKSTCKSKCFFQ